MSLLIDTPRWPWRGRLWAHLISDESLDELHAAARDLDLRYLSFGCDHYDVPDTVWAAACQRATLVDPREIVGSLRASGLRVGGGKRRKAWRRVDRLPSTLESDGVGDWLADVRPHLAEAAVEVLARPTEWLVLHILDGPERPELGELGQGPGSRSASVWETVADGRYSLELVIRPDDVQVADWQSDY